MVFLNLFVKSPALSMPNMARSFHILCTLPPRHFQAGLARMPMLKPGPSALGRMPTFFSDKKSREDPRVGRELFQTFDWATRGDKVPGTTSELYFA